MKLIPDARHKWWRLWSNRLHAAGLAIMCAFMAWGELPLMLWNMMPVEIRERVPDHIAFIFPALFFGAGIFARMIKQDKLNAETDK